jgi:hypothetical protein
VNSLSFFLDIISGIYKDTSSIVIGERKGILLMIAETIEHIADRVLAYEETDLSALLNHFKTRMEQFEPGPAWERAVIAYFLINGVRVKNALKQGKLNSQALTPGNRPALRLVK